MKTHSLVLLCGSALVLSSPAAEQATPLTSRVMERGQNFSKIESITQKQDASGQTVLKTNRYTRLKPGINRKDANGEWIESQPVLLNRPEGIVGTGGVYTVTISPDLNTRGAVDMRLPNGQRLQSHAIGLAWYDPDTGRSVLLAAVKSCTAEISSNQVIFRDAFDSGVSAAVVYKYEAGQFQQDVVFHSRPPAAPADFGPRTRLEVMTEIIEQPSITKKMRTLYEEKDAALRTARAEPDLVDETLQIGGTNGLRMIQGRAFPVGQASTNRAIVLKRLMTTPSGRTVLIESMPWEPVKAEFDKLPRTASVTPRLRTPSLERELPPLLLAKAEGVKAPEVLLAASPITKGFVLDYTTVTSEYYIPFEANATYFIDGCITTDTVSFFEHAVLKYSAYGSLYCESIWYFDADVTFTGMDDDSVGDTIDGSTGSPSWAGYGDPMLGPNNGGVIRGATFRYGYLCVFVSSSTLDVSSSSFSDSSVGIHTLYTYNGLILTTVDFCNVSYPLYVIPVGNYSSVTECGNVDYDGDGMSMDWELTWFGNTAQTGVGDYDGDGLSNYLEFVLGANPTIADTDGDGVIDQMFKANAGRPSVSSLIP